jgi:hypothetical protein
MPDGFNQSDDSSRIIFRIGFLLAAFFLTLAMSQKCSNPEGACRAFCENKGEDLVKIKQLGFMEYECTCRDKPNRARVLRP